MAPRLRDEGLVYRSPIVRLRQLFDLYVCLRPCRAFAGNPLNTREGIDLVIFRENTEDLYCRGGISPGAAETLSRLLEEISPSFAPFKGLAPDQWAISCKINSRKGSERIIRAAFEFARQHRRKRVTVVHKANVVRATDGLFLEAARRIAADYPDIPWDHANVDAMAMWLLKNPLDYDVLVAPNLFGDIVSDLCAQMVGGLGVCLLRQHRRPAGRLRADPRLRPQVRGTVQGQPHRHHSGRQNDAGLPVRGPTRANGWRMPWARSFGKAGFGPTTWAAPVPPCRWPRPSPANCELWISFGRSRDGNRGATPFRKRANPS